MPGTIDRYHSAIAHSEIPTTSRYGNAGGSRCTAANTAPASVIPATARSRARRAGSTMPRNTTSSATGMSTATTREDVARAYVEGLLCSLADGIAALEDRTGTAAARITLIGGAARSQAVQQLAPAIFGREVTIAPEGEYVALGAARQAAWALSGAEEAPAWRISGSRTVGAEPTPEVLGAYRELKDRTESWG